MEPYFIASIIGILSAGTRLEIALQNLRADGELSLDIPGHSIEAEFFINGRSFLLAIAANPNSAGSQIMIVL